MSSEPRSSSDPAPYLKSCKTRISARLAEFLSEKERDLGCRHADAPEILERLYAYTAGGKMLRGSLACLGYELFNPGGKPGSEALDLGVALELLQSGLLIHDDIMDGDDTRRGMPTLHKAYADLYSAAVPGANVAKADAVGSAIGICVGDICYFLAMEILGSLSWSNSSLFGSELVRVCLGQIRDVRSGAARSLPSIREVIETYRNKTARYTFTLPLAAGASLAKRPDAIPELERFGEAAGIAFQIRDDALGLFGDADTIGKPVGSDIREGKKTLHHILLMAAASPQEIAELSHIHGRHDLSPLEIDLVRNLTRHYGVDAQADRIAAEYVAEAERSIDSLAALQPHVNEAALELLRGFLDFATRRAS